MSDSTNDDLIRGYDDLPDDIKQRPQFVVWKLETAPGRDKPTKVPYSPTTGAKASVTDNLTWGTFEQTMTALLTGQYDGAGFVFSSGDPYTFIDADNAYDATEAERLHRLGHNGPMPGFKVWAEPWVKQLLSLAYIAVSQSGTGAHIILNGKLPGKGGKRPVDRNGEEVGKIEMYNVERFVALTGKTLASGTLTPAQTVINQVYAHFGFAPQGQGTGFGDGVYNGERWSTGLTDEDVLNKARNAKNGDTFRALYDAGDLRAYGGDHSGADLALVGMLTFYCGPNPEQIDRLVRGSKLFRSKWDEQHGDSTYGERTIGYALRERGTNPSDYFGRKATRSGDADEEREPKAFTIYNITEYRKRPVPDYVVKGVIQEASLAMVYGGFATFKSFLTLDMALSVAAGRPWQGYRTKQGPVLFIIGEGGGHFLKRVDAWLSFHGLTDVPDFLMLPDAPQLNTDKDLKALIDVVKALPVMPAMVVVDTVARTYAGNENATEDMGKYVAAAAAIQKLGPAVVLIHHTGKDGKYRGNSALPGALDTIIRVDRVKNGRVRVRNEKQKDDNEFPALTLKKNVVALGTFFNADTDVLDLNVPTSLVFTRDDSAQVESDDLTDAQRQVLRVLCDATGGLTFTAWLTAYGGPKSTFSDAKDLLVERGYVTAPPKGSKGARYTVTPDGRDVFETADTEGANDDAA